MTGVDANAWMGGEAGRFYQRDLREARKCRRAGVREARDAAGAKGEKSASDHGDSQATELALSGAVQALDQRLACIL